MTASLARQTAHGVVYLGIAQAVQIVATMVSTIIVARVLSPADYGVIAMTSPITGFILIFQSLGLNQAVIQSKSLDDEQVNTLFWYNIAASVAIGLLFILLSPLVAWFYGDSRPAGVMAANAATVLVTGSMLQHTALLNRNMRFPALSAVYITNSVFTVLFVVGFALWLRSYWALFLGSFCGTVLACGAAWQLDRWRPRLAISIAGTRGMLAFGANVTGFNLLNYLGRNIDNVLIAKVWGAAALGLYDRSYRLMMFPLQNINTPLARAMLPALSRLVDEPERYRRVFVTAIRALALLSVPGVIVGAICCHEVVLLLLGERWIGAERIFFWLSFAAVTQPISNATGWLFISSGRARAMMHWGVISTPITIASFVAGLPWGASGVAAAYFFSQALRLPLLYRLCTRETPVHQRDLYLALAPSLVGGAAAYVVISLVRGSIGSIPLVALAVCCSYAFAIAAQASTQTGRAALKDIVRLTLDSVTLRLKPARRASAIAPGAVGKVHRPPDGGGAGR